MQAFFYLHDTKSGTRYDISFTYMPEKKGDLEQTLAGLGLQLKKVERDIDMLVFR